VATADALLAPISSESDTSGVAESAKVRVALWRHEPDRALAAIDVPDEEWLEDIARNSLPAAQLRARAWLAKGDIAKAATEYAAARVVLEDALRQRPENFNVMIAIAEADAGLGRDADAREEAARAMELMPADRDAITGPSVMTSLAETYARLADARKAVELLKRLESMPAGDLASVASLRGETCWDPIRGDAAFEATIAEYASIEARRNESAAREP
jgi:tetratricopeptide (TPR) repeat protein